MGNKEILVDTSIIIDHLRKANKKESVLYNIEENNTLFISTISIFELWAGAIDERKAKDIETVLLFFESLPVTSEVAKIAGNIFLKLKGKNKLIETRDIFIGATALVYKLPLLTFNKSHFEKIEEVNVLNR